MKLHPILLPIFSLFLLSFTLEPNNQVWASWIAFIPLLYYIYNNPNPVRDTLFGYVYGMLYCGLGVFWTIAYKPEVYWKVTTLTGVPFAVFFGLVSIVARYNPPKDGKNNLLLNSVFPSIVWGVLLYVFRLTPVGPIPLEEPFHQPLILLQLASVGSMWMLAFIILWFNAVFALLILRRDQSTQVLASCVTLLCIGAGVWGWQRLERNPIRADGIPIAIVQPNFPMGTEWKKGNPQKILDLYERMGALAASMNPEIIFFPQYAIPVDALRETEFLQRLSQEFNAHIVLASYVPQVEGKDVDEGLYNMGLVYSPEGLTGHYNSVVGPPYRNINQSFGEKFPELTTPAGKMGFLLCFEDTVRWVGREWVEKDVHYFADTTNTGHFVGTVQPGYHLMQARLRAIENKKQVVRVTPNGYSAVIDEYGRFRVLSDLEREQVLFSILVPNES